MPSLAQLLRLPSAFVLTVALAACGGSSTSSGAAGAVAGAGTIVDGGVAATTAAPVAGDKPDVRYAP